MSAGALMASLLAAVLCAAPAQARPDPGGVPGAMAGWAAAPMLPTAPTPGMVEVTVRLRTEASLPLAGSQGRSERLRQVELALRAHAATSQRGLLQLLSARQQTGQVGLVVPLWIANEVIVRATPSVIQEIARRPDVLEVRPATTVQAPSPAAATSAATPEANLAVVGAPQLWAQGRTGQGVVVASLDTGVDATHPDLAGRWRGGTNSWYDPSGQHPTTPTDVSGHGTQVMGVMVGDGTGGRQVGMAPGATWIAAKIFNDWGQATTTGIHLAFQWLLDPDRNPATPDAPNVANNSWTMSTATCDTQFQADLQSLRAVGILPIFAAGNYGPLSGTVRSPANNPEALAVGATDNSDALYPYSSRGPSACSTATAPALTAPGTSITTTDLYGGYAVETGTSMAAPHVTGAVALLLSGHPGTTSQRQYDALTLSAHDLGASGLDPDFGYGRLDVPAADAWLGATPDFSLAVTPASATAAPGGSTAYDVAVSAANGFLGDVSIGAAGLPGGVTATSDPAVVAGGSGISRLTLTLAGSVAPGTYPFTVTGTSGSLVRSAAATLVVPSPSDFAVALTPASVQVAPGGAAALTASVTSLNGFDGTVQLSVSGIPSMVGSASVSPATVTAAGTAQVTIQTLASAPAGTYPITLTGVSGSTTHTAQASLVVKPPPDFTLTASPTSISVRRGYTGSVSLATAALNGFTGSVTLSASGLPAATTATFTPNPIGVPGSGTLRLHPDRRTPRGTYVVTVTGTSGSVAHTVTVTLTVT